MGRHEESGVSAARIHQPFAKRFRAAAEKQLRAGVSAISHRFVRNARNIFYARASCPYGR